MFFDRLGVERGLILRKTEGLSVKIPVRGRCTVGSISLEPKVF